MPIKTTEDLHDCAAGLDQRPPADIAALLAHGQVAAAAAVQAAIPAICTGAEAMARTIASGGSLHYAAAGSSGLMAAADAQELGGTFSIPPEQVHIHMAGGLPSGVEMPGGTEDEIDGLSQSMAGITDQDCVIAVSASGTTPYTLAATRLAKSKGAAAIGIANNGGSALLEMVDHAVLLETPPELLSGSTRMGAGTAQKIALNMLSTLMAVHLGHVHDGMMVNLRADNIKLQSRARGIVAKIANVSEEKAGSALVAAGGDVKTAIMIAAQGLSEPEATAALQQANGHLRLALKQTPVMG